MSGQVQVPSTVVGVLMPHSSPLRGSMPATHLDGSDGQARRAASERPVSGPCPPRTSHVSPPQQGRVVPALSPPSDEGGAARPAFQVLAYLDVARTPGVAARDVMLLNGGLARVDRHRLLGCRVVTVDG